MINFKPIIPILILPILLSCGGEATEVQAEQTEAVSTDISLSKEQFDLGKMELGTFTNQSFRREISANGMLDVPPENQSTVSAYFGGYVKTLSLLQGQKVTKGQTLFTLESPEYILVQQDFLEAKSQLNYLKSDYERQKELAAGNVSSQKTFMKAESEYKVTLARFESLKKRLQLMNINPNSVTETNLRSIIPVTAPISGYVTSVLATKGMYLNPSDIAVKIMNTDHIHIELTIFERDLSRVKVGQKVSFNLQNDSKTYDATVHLINKTIDPEKRSVSVHCHFVNDKDAQSMTPGMYAEGKIYATSDSSLALPVNAVVEVENKSYVLIQKNDVNGKLEFERVEVNVGETNDGYIEILNAKQFNNQSQILIEGAFNLIKE